jgi:hypothetical protein
MTPSADVANMAAIKSPIVRSGQAEPVTKTQPGRAHVDIVRSAPAQQEQTHVVGGQGEQSYPAHDVGSGHVPSNDLQDGLYKHPEAERRHHGALEQCGPGLPDAAPADHIEAEAIHDGVSQHVHRVGQERCRIREKPGPELNEEHPDVDPQYDLEDPTLLDGNVGHHLAAVLHGG